MNTELIMKLARFAEEKVQNERKLKDGQIERTFRPQDMYVCFAGLLLQDVLSMTDIHYPRSTNDNYYAMGLVASQNNIQQNIRSRYDLSENVEF